jgi:pantoate kinase
MKAIAFSPGHLSGFFEPIMKEKDYTRTGSRGAGMSISLGAISEVTLEPSTQQHFEFMLNGTIVPSPVQQTALQYLLGSQPCYVTVNTTLELPLSQGFGMSGASALSAGLALIKLVNIPKTEALKAAHYAEIMHKTGLGDVISQFFGGIEIRKQPGLPPWGIIEHIPGMYEVVLCVVGEKLDTTTILSNPDILQTTAHYGKLCTKKLLENPSIETLVTLSQTFARETKLAQGHLLEAIDIANSWGMASMCMLGNSLFAIGKTKELCDHLSSFGPLFICTVDEGGARNLSPPPGQ